jgi:hypothetical protein
MFTLEDLMAEFEGLEISEAAFEAEPNLSSSGGATTSDTCECRVPRRHHCCAKYYTAYQAEQIVLWRRLDYPNERAAHHSRRVQMFNRFMIKVDAPRGMPNGLSPLRTEVLPEDVKAWSKTKPQA